MCGIVGFTGKSEAAPILLDGLSKLEYRGYDSAGIAVRNGDAEPEIVKAKGKLKVLKEMTNDGKAVKGSCGVPVELGIHAGQRMVNHLLQTLTRIAVTTKMLLQYITALSRTIRNFVKNWSKRVILSSHRLIQKWLLS